MKKKRSAELDVFGQLNMFDKDVIESHITTKSEWIECVMRPTHTRATNNYIQIKYRFEIDIVHH